MIAFVKRDLKLFFSSASTMFFSLLGALIAFVLYLVFLKSTMTSNIPFDSKSVLLDPWVIGGTLAVTAVTTTMSALSQMIKDRETGTLADFLMTKMDYWQLQISYLISAVIIGFLMQVIMALIMFGYFALTDGISIPWNLAPEFLYIAAISSVVWTAFSLLCLSFVKRVDTLGKLGTIIGTAAGFFAGVYFPISSMPSAAQTLIKLTPAPYNAALYRELLMKSTINNKFTGVLSTQKLGFEKAMGIKISVNSVLSQIQLNLVMLGFMVLFLIISLALMRQSRRSIMVRI